MAMICNDTAASNELAVEFGSGYSRPNLTQMIRLAEVFPAREVVVTLSRCLWSPAGPGVGPREAQTPRSPE